MVQVKSVTAKKHHTLRFGRTTVVTTILTHNYTVMSLFCSFIDMQDSTFIHHFNVNMNKPVLYELIIMTVIFSY